MRFPSKVTTYNDSILSKFPVVLTHIKNNDLTPNDLYIKVKSKVSDVGEFIEILNCLYALNKIELIESKGVLHYVKGDSM